MFSDNIYLSIGYSIKRHKEDNKEHVIVDSFKNDRAVYFTHSIVPQEAYPVPDKS
jgi:hypothetical protein